MLGADFLAVSRLFAKERGPHAYRLVMHPKFHDRWLRCDGRICVLGGSVKDAAMKSDFTIGTLDPSASNMKKLDDTVAEAAELFGPSSTAHP